ncbi:sensor histidine kinase N-terminal domain-containing protein [Acidovorax sp. SUPP2522]|uniref:ATP-binding protein n=2 Tax=unclassified Acidovorax TaxID=2684926 RepID=UPI0023491025|nr:MULTISPECIES: ATP-binding protein [unclassified Acidovorax]WCM96869.1 ATP-binding protein [Acidovorax sp. GBBC 1281]GKT14942.1 sensor histidine kinase N-terminal domain-containing protein [Acidovorax sp. SUPP2522]
MMPPAAQDPPHSQPPGPGGPAPRTGAPAHSLRARLLWFLLAAIVCTALLQILLSYRSALSEADEIFDYHMEQMAMALRPGLPEVPANAPGPLVHDDENYEFVVQVWSAEGLRVFESAVGAALPQRAVLGFSRVKAHGTTYRVFSVQTRSQVIQVAQDMAVRKAMARDLALRTAGPIALMAPLLALAVWWVVSGSLAPVERVRREVAQRQADDLSPVDGDALPAEVQPLVDELNLLFARVQRAFEAQQHFVADAAHELRSPLAALKLQAQGLLRAPDAEARGVAVARLSAGIDRATRLVEQLLALARQESSVAAGAPAQPVVLADLALQAVADAAPAAQQRGIDLGLARADATPIAGHAEALRILLRNLVDNAVKYTPDGGVVDVHVIADAPANGAEPGGAVTLVVDDSGPGIGEGDRERVLGRFYRAPQAVEGGAQVPGSGLGLAIVQSIARMHQAQVALEGSPRLGGLRVSVRFDALAGAAPSAPVPEAPSAGDGA